MKVQLLSIQDILKEQERSIYPLVSIINPETITLEKLDKFIQRNKTQLMGFGLYDEDKLVGFTFITDSGLSFNVFYFVILPEYQCRGFGTQFWEKIENCLTEIMRSVNLEKITLSLSCYGGRLQRFWLLKKFSISGEYQRKGKDLEYIMSKTLVASI